MDNVPVERDMVAEFKLWREAYPDTKNMMVIMRQNVLDKGNMHICAIAVPDYLQGRGLARAAMAEIIRLSDELGINITLEASEEGECGPWLQEWYGRLGFEMHDKGCGEYGPYMVRNAMPHPVLSMK